MHYPFSALAGQDQLKTALLLCAVDPRIGGVLISGERGTAKSTAARALAAICPPLRVVAGCPFRCDPAAPWSECPHCAALAEHAPLEIPTPRVDLPLGATEDRVVGTLDFERALREGRKALQPGLLASAHRGILYIDEVNLLADHLVDVLLDAAASGINSVQREGIELTHPARFVLIGTMNPEEGELRPQLLDRFGLMVRIASPREAEPRAEIVRRRLAFEESPRDFAARWSQEETRLRDKIASARLLLEKARLEDSLLVLITQLCCEMEVDGLRGDIVLAKASCALAALEGRTAVTSGDVRAAAELVLPHRRRSRHAQSPAPRQQRPNSESQSPDGSPDPTPPNAGSNGESDANGASPGDNVDESHVFPAPPPESARPITLEPASGDARPPRGRRGAAMNQSSGRYVSATADATPTDIAIDATVRAAALRGGWRNGRLNVERGDLRQKRREGRAGALILFVVDASGSMAARRRMEAVKGAVLSLLRQAYHQRDQVAMIVVRGAESQLLLPPTGSVELAERALQALPTGGRTPLAHALSLAGEVIRREQRANQECSLLMVLLTDGKANVCQPATSGDAFQQAIEAARHFASARVPSLVLDTDHGVVRFGRAQQLATALAAEYLPLEELSCESVVREVRERRQALTVKTHV